MCPPETTSELVAEMLDPLVGLRRRRVPLCLGPRCGDRVNSASKASDERREQVDPYRPEEGRRGAASSS